VHASVTFFQFFFSVAVEQSNHEWFEAIRFLHEREKKKNEKKETFVKFSVFINKQQNVSGILLAVHVSVTFFFNFLSA
jgi:hypothetical protein